MVSTDNSFYRRYSTAIITNFWVSTIYVTVTVTEYEVRLGSFLIQMTIYLEKMNLI